MALARERTEKVSALAGGGGEAGGGQVAGLVPCEFCGRKFLPDRLPVHLRVCKKMKEPLMFMYTPVKKDENVLQCEHLERIYELEKEIQDFEDFEEVCLKNIEGDCLPLTSVTNYLMPDGKCPTNLKELLANISDTSDELAASNPQQYWRNLAAYAHFDEDF